jgi:hypothetical protein
MFTAKVENSSGDTLVLTGKEAAYQLVNIEGLNPPPAQLNSSNAVGIDGAIFNSSKLETRNIVLTVYINGEVEKNRLLLYSFFRTKERCVFYFKNDSLDVSIEGYVETVECNMFSQNVVAQISIICMFPYFQSLGQIAEATSNSEALFVFPFSINFDAPVPISNLIEGSTIAVFNNSESATGCEIVAYVREDFEKLYIFDNSTGEHFTIMADCEAGDTIIINTVIGKKTVQRVRDGILSNLFAAVSQILPSSSSG